MQISAKELCKLVQGELEGDAEVILCRPAKIEEAQPDTISFIANPKYEQYATRTNAGVLIVSRNFKTSADIRAALIKVEDPYKCFTKVLEKFQNDLLNKTGVDERSFVSPNAKIGDDVYLGAFSYVGDGVVIGDRVRIFPNSYLGDNVKVGSNTLIYSGVNIYNSCEIGENCIIHSGAIVGSDGFGFTPQEDGTFGKIPQIGIVVLEDNVEIGANTCIDRGTMGSTMIRRGVKLDNLIQVAHNVEIGENTAIAAQAGVSGSTKLGSNCIIGGQAGFVGHLVIADGTKVNAQSGVNKSVRGENQSLMGTPAFDYRQNLKSQVIFRKLPELQKKLWELQKKIEELEKK